MKYALVSAKCTVMHRGVVGIYRFGINIFLQLFIGTLI